MSAQSQPLVQFAEGIWLGSDPVRIVGMPLASTMTVLRLGAGELLLYSPVAMTAERRAAVEALGRVAHLYAPNLFHHRWIGDWAAAFPSARMHAPAGLAKKRRDLRIDRVHGGTPEPGVRGPHRRAAHRRLPPGRDRPALPPRADAGGRRSGSQRRPARPPLVRDLHAIDGLLRSGCPQPRDPLDRLHRQARRAPKRRRDPRAAFDRLVVGHGDPLPSGGHDAFAAAYSWLKG